MTSAKAVTGLKIFELLIICDPKYSTPCFTYNLYVVSSGPSPLPKLWNAISSVKIPSHILSEAPKLIKPPIPGLMFLCSSIRTSSSVSDTSSEPTLKIWAPVGTFVLFAPATVAFAEYIILWNVLLPPL